MAKRLNEELASQQHSLESQRPISPDTEPRSRSYEQRDPKSAKGMFHLDTNKIHVVAAAFEYVSCFAFQKNLFLFSFMTSNTTIICDVAIIGRNMV